MNTSTSHFRHYTNFSAYEQWLKAASIQIQTKRALNYKHLWFFIRFRDRISNRIFLTEEKDNFPSRTSLIFLCAPRFPFNWQHSYRSLFTHSTGFGEMEVAANAGVVNPRNPAHLLCRVFYGAMILLCDSRVS